MLALLMPEILARLLFSEAEKDATLHKRHKHIFVCRVLDSSEMIFEFKHSLKLK